MKLEIKTPGAVSPCRLKFYNDGSFGQGEPYLYLDYEINLSKNGSLALFASANTGICYCLEGFSWKGFSEQKKGPISLDRVEEGQLRFSRENEDPIEWGCHYCREFELTLIDDRKKLALYGELPINSVITRFAPDQFVCRFRGEVVGFIIDYSALGQQA